MSVPDIKLTKPNCVRLNSGNNNSPGSLHMNRRSRSRSVMNKNKRRNSKLDDKVPHIYINKLIAFIFNVLFIALKL